MYLKSLVSRSGQMKLYAFEGVILRELKKKKKKSIKLWQIFGIWIFDLIRWLQIKYLQISHAHITVPVQTNSDSLQHMFIMEQVYPEIVDDNRA